MSMAMLNRCCDDIVADRDGIVPGVSNTVLDALAMPWLPPLRDAMAPLEPAVTWLCHLLLDFA